MTEKTDAPIPSFHIDAGILDIEAALAAYGEAAGDLFHLENVETELQASLAMHVWHLGAIMVGRFAASSLRFHRDPALIAASGLDHLLVQLYVDGRFEADLAGRSLVVEAGDIAVFDLTRPVRSAPGRFRNVSLLIPRVMIEESVDDVALLHGALLPSGNPLSDMLGSYMTSLIDRAPNMEARHASTAARATATLAGAILSGSGTRLIRSQTGPVSPFRSIMREIASGLKDPSLDAAAISRKLGMSRASLYRFFEPLGGVADYIRRRRLAGAALALSDPVNGRRKIAEIAFDWGFASEATFARAFKQAFGISPGVARSRSSTLWQEQGTLLPPGSPKGFARSVRLLGLAARP